MIDAVHDLLRDQLDASVPFARHTGVRLVRVGDGEAVAVLPDEPFTKNHVGSQHAGALFTLAEAASGAAMAGALAPMILEVRPLVRTARATYRKLAKGEITATATTGRPADELRVALERDGRVEFEVAVTMRDALDVEVATLDVEWVVTRPR